MLKLTDAGRALCETMTKYSYAENSDQPTIYFKDEEVTVDISTAKYYSLCFGATRSLLYCFFGLLRQSTGTVLCRYGGTFTEKTGVTITTENYSVNCVTLPYYCYANIVTDETTGFSSLAGVMSNGTDETIEVKYIGLSPNIYCSGVGGAGVAVKSTNWGITNYIELDEPITIAPGEDYPFKISI